MRKIIILSIVALFSGVFGVWAQFADVSYNVRVDRMEHYEGGIGGNCWESGNEEYTGYAGFSDNVNGGVSWSSCQTCSNNGNCTYGQNVFIGSRTNNADRIDPNVDGWEDDAGDRCTHNSGDDCRTGPGDRGDIFFRLLAFPSASGSYSINAVGGFGDGDFRVWYDIDWRYAGTANAITPTCATQSVGYAAGSIRSWSVFLTAGRTYRFGTCGAAEDTYIRIYGSDGFSIVGAYDDNGPLCGGTAASGDYTPGASGWYYVEVSRFSRNALTAGGTLTYEDITPAPGNPAIFGNNQWLVYGFTGGNINLSGEYSGFYTENNLSFNTLNRWGTLGSPSDASGWQGCYVPVDNHVVVSKRQGFPCGNYQLSMPNNDDDVQVYVNGTLVASGGCCNTLTGVFWTGYLGATSTVEVRHLEGGGGSNHSLTLTNIGGAPGNPATFGNNQWLVYGYQGGNIDLTGNYYGFYTESNLSFNTLNRWGTNGSPSDASGWQGCYVPVDNHVVVSKRQGFPCGNYRLDVPNHDDDYRVYVNGTLVFEHIGCCDAHTGVWTGYLGATSTVEVRHLEGGGGSHQSLTLVNLGGAPGNPTVFGNGFWNVYGYNAGDAAGGSGAWTNNYSGFYTENILSFNTQTRWASGGTPSDANNAS